MEQLDVCYASSDEYAIHTGISLLSLFENNPGLVRRVYLLDYGIQEQNRQRLTKTCSDHGVECLFTPALDTLAQLGKANGLMSFRNSYATYSRAFLDQLLPEQVDRVLYIDSDTVITGSVESLLHFDMTDKVIAGVASCFRYSLQTDEPRGKDSELDLLSGNKLYIQCGILLYCLDHWRKAGCFEMIQHACTKLEKMRFADQTLINNAIPERYFGMLPIGFNLTMHNYCDEFLVRQYRRGGWYSEDEIRQALAHPTLIHFNGGRLQRPWFAECVSRRKEVYYHYKALSPWRDVPLISVSKSTMSFRQRLNMRLTAWAMGAKTDVMARVFLKVSSKF